MVDVLILAEQDTRLGKASVHERSGPCPRSFSGKCDRKRNGFSVKLDDNGRWVFKCRGCWDPQEVIGRDGKMRGFGDEADYLMHFREMEPLEALATAVRDCELVFERGYKRLAYLKKVRDGQSLLYDDAKVLLETALAQLGEPEPSKTSTTRRPPSVYRNRWETPVWQKKARDAIWDHAWSIWDPYDDQALAAYEYIQGRGFTDEVLRKGWIGFSMHGGVPWLIVPDCELNPDEPDMPGHTHAVHRRDLRPELPEDEPRWKLAGGSNPDHLYLAYSLERKRPTVLVESPLDALSVAQEAGDLVNAVATGSTDRGKTVENLAQLALQPLVLVAFDADVPGDKAASWWLKRLPGSQRLRPFLKDINEMLSDGWDLRAWIEQALQKYALAQDASGEIPPDVLAAMDEQPLCMLCDAPGLYEGDYEGEEVMYCEQHHPGRAVSLAYAERLIARADEKIPGLNLKVSGNFHASQEEAYKQQRLRELAESLPRTPVTYEPDPDAVLTQDEQGVLRRIEPGAYGLYVSRQCCECGCRIRYTSINGDACAACEPGAIWPHHVLRLLRPMRERLWA